MSTAFLATLIITFQLAGCSKDDTPTPANTSIDGLWTGSYSISIEPELEQYFSLVFKPDGTLINDTKYNGQQHLNIGTWTLSGDQLSCHVVCVYGNSTNLGVEEDFTASFDKVTGKITNGVWKNTPPLDGHGAFQVNKIN
jgi:hypothetical protein